MINFGKCFLLILSIIILIPLDAFSETYTETINFTSTQAYTYNYNWKHSLSELPQGAKIQSAEIKLRAKVWYWGWNIYEQNIDIMASDTTTFSLPNGRICELNPSTNPNPSNFYTVTCQLSSNQFGFIENDKQIYIGTNTYGGTYYLDYCTLTVVAAQPAKYTLTVNIKPGSKGSVTLNPLGGIYNDGQLVSLTAYKASGYVFDFWTGDVADTALNPTTVTMDMDKTVVANFAEDRDNDGVKDSADGCPDDINKTDSGQCGCGQDDTDTDNDGTADCVDTDDDNDGMPDTWENQHGFDPLVDDAYRDADSDGYSNLQEYRSGTDPTDPNSKPSTKSMPWVPLLLLDD